MVAFNPVTRRCDRVLILACGPSAARLDLDLLARAREVGVYVLAVNRAIEWAQDVDGWFTLDPDDRALPLAANPVPGVEYFMAVPDDYGRHDARVHYHRNAPLFSWVRYLRRKAGGGPLKSCEGLSERPDVIHTGNSAYGALGVAFHMHAKRVGLVGVDGIGRGYAYLRGTPRTTFDHLPALFASAVAQLDARGVAVMNGSPESAVGCFGRCEPDGVVKWLML